MEKLERYLAGIAAAAFLLALALQAVAYQKVATDDAFIFYRYAANLAAGHGYVFNEGERALGTTSPLYTLILAATQRLFGWIPGITPPLLGGLISILSLGLIALITARFFRQAARPFGAMLAPLVMSAVALFWSGVGMDVLPALAFGLAAISQYHAGRSRQSAALAAFAVLARPDLACVPALLAFDAIVLRRRRPCWRCAAIFAVILASWLAFSRFYFGSMVPASVTAKLGQAGNGVWGGDFGFLRGFNNLWPCHASIKDATLVLFALALPLAVAGGRRLRGFRPGWLALAWIGTYTFFYGFVLRPAAYPWYYVPVALGMGIIMVIAIDTAAGHLFARNRRAGTFIVLAAILWLGWAGAYQAARTLREPRHYKYLFYTEAAAWLNEHAETGAVVASNEIGVLGYYYEKGPILDLLGLVSPEVAPHVNRGDFDWPVRNLRPEYVIFKVPPFPGLEDLATDPWFLEHYALEIVMGAGPTKLGLYRRVS